MFVMATGYIRGFSNGADACSLYRTSILCTAASRQYRPYALNDSRVWRYACVLQVDTLRPSTDGQLYRNYVSAKIKSPIASSLPPSAQP